MPFEWSKDLSKAPVDAGALLREGTEEPLSVLSIWPHQSLTPEGFAWFIVPTVALFAFPLFAVLGSPVLWVLLACFGLAVWAVWFAVSVNQRRSARTSEELSVWVDKLRLVHRNAKGERFEWEGNPYWISIRMIESGGPAENYLVLKGSDREVELGAFLSPDERVDLKASIETVVARLKSHQ